MAKIELKNLDSNLTGIDLFDDSESFMQDLSERELDLHGGKAPQVTARLSIFCRPLPMPTPPIKWVQ
jgi:hypothetical protein